LNQIRGLARVPGYATIENYASLERMPEVQEAINMEVGNEELQLILAAKEEAAAALQLAAEAEKIAQKISDPAKKALIMNAIKEVKLCSQRVIECAESLSKSPRDPVLQQRLANAQLELGNAIQKVVNLTSTNDRELTDAMNEMRSEIDQSNSAEAQLLRAAQEVLDEIAAHFNSDKKMKPEETIARAKELAAKAAELARKLKEMAATTTDPIFKEKLQAAAKFIRDSSIQIKILSAVKAAGGDDKSNSVQMSARGLQTNIAEVIKVVQTQAIRNRFKSTVKQTMAINKVLRLWRRAN